MRNGGEVADATSLSLCHPTVIFAYGTGDDISIPNLFSYTPKRSRQGISMEPLLVWEPRRISSSFSDQLTAVLLQDMTAALSLG